MREEGASEVKREWDHSERRVRPWLEEQKKNIEYKTI